MHYVVTHKADGKWHLEGGDGEHHSQYDTEDECYAALHDIRYRDFITAAQSSPGSLYFHAMPRDDEPYFSEEMDG